MLKLSSGDGFVQDIATFWANRIGGGAIELVVQVRVSPGRRLGFAMAGDERRSAMLPEDEKCCVKEHPVR